MRKIHQALEYAGALFHVVSQPNPLEMVGPGATKVATLDVEVRLVSYGAPSATVRELAKQLA